jgi:hypothetical protein
VQRFDELATPHPDRARYRSARSTLSHKGERETRLSLASCLHRFSYQTADVLDRPYSLAGVGFARSPLPVSPRFACEGMARRKGAALVLVRTLLPRCGASRRATAASCRLPGRAFGKLLRPAFVPSAPVRLIALSRIGASGKLVSLPVSELLAAGRSARGRSPGAAREGEERSSPPRGRRIRSHHQDASRQRPHWIRCLG